MTAPTSPSPAPVLVATDLGEWGDLAIREGDRWARELSAPLLALHCVPAQIPLVPPWAMMSKEQQAALDDIGRAARASLTERVGALTGRTATEFVVLIGIGTPHVEIVRAAEVHQAALVVVGARASSGLARLIAGHSAEKVARYAHCPVLVVRPGARTDHVLVATDLSPGAAEATRVAAEVAARRGARLTAVYVIDTGLPFPVEMGSTPFDAPTSARLREAATDELRKRLREQGVTAEARVADGLVIPSLEDAVRKLGADLVVLGTVGRTGLARMMLGNTAEAAIRELPCSVLVVRGVPAAPAPKKDEEER